MAVRHRPLLLPRRGSADRSDLAVRPGLARDPLDRVVSIGRSAGEICGLSAFRKEPAPFVLDDDCLARGEDNLIPGRTAPPFTPSPCPRLPAQDDRYTPIALLKPGTG